MALTCSNLSITFASSAAFISLLTCSSILFTCFIFFIITLWALACWIWKITGLRQGRLEKRRTYLRDDAIDTWSHDQELIMRCTVLNCCFSVDSSGFDITRLFQSIQRFFPTGFVLLLSCRCFFFDHFFRESKIKLRIGTHDINPVNFDDMSRNKIHLREKCCRCLLFVGVEMSNEIRWFSFFEFLSRTIDVDRRRSNFIPLTVILILSRMVIMTMIGSFCVYWILYVRSSTPLFGEFLIFSFSSRLQLHDSKTIAIQDYGYELFTRSTNETYPTIFQWNTWLRITIANDLSTIDRISLTKASLNSVQMIWRTAIEYVWFTVLNFLFKIGRPRPFTDMCSSISFETIMNLKFPDDPNAS